MEASVSTIDRGMYGAPQGYRLIDDVEVQGTVVRYTLQPAQSGFSECTGEYYRFHRFSAAYRAEIDRAVKAWEEACGIDLVEVPWPAADAADPAEIYVGLTSLDGRGGVVGRMYPHSTIEEFARLCGEDITLQGDEAFVYIDHDDFGYYLSPHEAVQFHNTILHELGHAIGIGHSDRTRQVMSGNEPGDTPYWHTPLPPVAATGRRRGREGAVRAAGPERHERRRYPARRGRRRRHQRLRRTGRHHRRPGSGPDRRGSRTRLGMGRRRQRHTPRRGRERLPAWRDRQQLARRRRRA